MGDKASPVGQMVKNLPAMKETQLPSLGWEDPLEKEMATTPVLLRRESYGWRSLVGYSPWGCKESDMTERLYFLMITIFSFLGRVHKNEVTRS